MERGWELTYILSNREKARERKKDAKRQRRKTEKAKERDIQRPVGLQKSTQTVVSLMSQRFFLQFHAPLSLIFQFSIAMTNPL